LGILLLGTDLSLGTCQVQKFFKLEIKYNSQRR
jgi:hypothetical protein